ncbi:MAG: hypothetical protein IH600_08040 [Bacteroidetes bacterium]|nr:hypothetical protein [Bacteroidota bacterium]
MSARTIFGFIVLVFFLAQAGYAGGTGEIQKYFNNTANDVKAASAPAEKRAILENSLQTVSRALDRVESSGMVTDADRSGIDRFRNSLREKQSELQGTDGFDRVADSQLDGFANYVVQDMQQADQYITISLVALLLIVIVLILIL